MFRGLHKTAGRDPVRTAEVYGQRLFDARLQRIQDEDRFSRSAFDIGLTVDSGEFELLTKRSTLISDSLLLSHGWTAPYRELGRYCPTDDSHPHVPARGSVAPTYHSRHLHLQNNSTTTYYGMHCPDLAALGTWLRQAEPLLKAGLVWYLPSYSTQREERVNAERRPRQEPAQVTAVDYIIRNGRLIDPSEANPVTCRLLRPVLQIELPFIEGVTLKDFSDITVEEFDSYKGFRNFLRGSFLSMDQALNGEQTEVELTRLRLDIEDQVHAMRADFYAARRKRAWAATGAVAASTAALLVAVNGSVLEHVLTTLGFTTAGTFWGAITARVENSPHAIKSGKWYYVWILSKRSRTL